MRDTNNKQKSEETQGSNRPGGLVVRRPAKNEGLRYRQEMLDMIQPGKKVRLFYSEENPNNQLRHIRAIVDDEYIVYRVWSSGKQTWRYSVDWVFGFKVVFDAGFLTAAE